MEKGDSIEVTGRSVEEAMDLALSELGAAREEVEVDILSRGKSGLLGFGAEPARVRVTLLSPRPATERWSRAAEREEQEPASPEVVDQARELTEELLRLMKVSAQASVHQGSLPHESNPVIEVEGEDSGLLIGRRGETLQALQFLVNYLLHRTSEENTRVVVDVEGYKERRTRALYALAQRVAERVVSSGRPVTLEPMPPAERRIVHLALAEHSQVATQSIGDGTSRKVSIFKKR